jgi:IMP dehydrogenase
MGNKEISWSLAFDDVLLRPAYSEVLPKDVDVSSFISSSIRLQVPLVSAGYCN